MNKPEKITVGWQEWCALPEFKIPAIKAKIDTGAKTSAIHAFDIYCFKKHNKNFVRFNMHPLQFNDKVSRLCMAEVVDVRHIMSSNGHKELRYVIKTTLEMADQAWEIQLTLSNRDPLRFRMLLGREALASHVTIDPAHMLCIKKIKPLQLRVFYHYH